MPVFCSFDVVVILHKMRVSEITWSMLIKIEQKVMFTSKITEKKNSSWFGAIFKKKTGILPTLPG